MQTKLDQRAQQEFQEHLTELAETWYDGDQRKAFRHAAFQIIVPDPTLSDEQVIELTAIDKSGDLEVDGYFVDDESETVFLFQATGGQSPTAEDKVAKFWQAPEELLNSRRIAESNNQSVRDLSNQLNEKLSEDFSISMVFAAKAGFARSAKSFAESRSRRERALTSLNGEELGCQCSFELFDFDDVARAFDDFRAGFRTEGTDVDLTINMAWTYEVDQSSPRSVRATVPASEIVRVFAKNGYKLFDLNPRGPIANAKVNKNISKTLDTQDGRSRFHLLNNGMCATCDDFSISDGGKVSVKNLQIVNGCQTTVTLSKRTRPELDQTHVDLKLVVADRAFAQEIAEASNSQTALRAKDYTSFEKQQRSLEFQFAQLQPPWYYEIKQGYWRFVLSDRDKARFKTGRKKRHIEVQPLAQASLAFLGNPSVALDRVRYVFQGIRSQEDRVWYERAFPQNISAQQLILPWTALQHILRETPSTRFANFHILWLIARMLRQHYEIARDQYFSSDLSSRLVKSIDDWLPDRYRVANSACSLALRRARAITGEGEDLESRDFFRGTRDYGGVGASALIWEACEQELEIAHSRSGDLPGQLPD